MNDVTLNQRVLGARALFRIPRPGIGAGAIIALMIAFQAPAQVIYGVDFGPYTDFQNPTVNPTISAATITARLQSVAPYTKWIRTYGSTNGLENIPQIAKSMGLKVAAEAWIGSNSTLNAQEIANLIANGQKGLINVAIVGSEALLNGSVSASTLIGYIQQVQQALPGIPVTTADVPYILLENPSVMAACSFVAIDEYPYWEDVPITSALAQTIGEYENVVQNAGGKQVWIAEAGWPSAGETEGSAVATPANAGKYLLDFVNWANGASVPYFLFEAEDEPWAALDQGPQGGAWGLLTDTGQVKPWVAPVLASNGMTCGTSTRTIQISYIPPYGSSGSIEGNACGLNADSASVVGYLNVAGGWWVKPYTDSYLEKPNAGDGYFSVNMDTGGIDYDALMYALFAVPDSYTPPALGGASSLPAALSSNATASLQVSRSVNSISGQILDSQGNPLSGVELSLTGADTGVTTTALDGRWSFTFLDGGAHTVQPSLQNYSFMPASANVPGSSGGQAVTFTGTSLTALTVQPASLQFSSYTAGGPAPNPLQLQISTMNPARGAYYIAAPETNCNWLTATAATGFTPQTLQFSANITNLGIGNYTCAIIVTAGNVSTTVPVSLAVSVPTTISATPTNINFATYTVGGPIPAAQPITITSTNPASGVAFTAQLGAGCAWLNLSATSGFTPATIQASLGSPLPQSPGALTCSISVVGPGTSIPLNATLQVVAATTLTAVPASINFPTYTVGGPAPAAQLITITSTNPASGVAFTAQLGAGCGWLNLSATIGFTPATIQASLASPLPQSPGTLTCSVSVVGAGTSVPVNAVLLITSIPITISGSLLNAQVHVAYSASIGISGGVAPYSVSIVSGALPSGLALTPEGVVAGAALNAGAYSFTITAIDSTGSRASAKLSMTVLLPGLGILTQSLPPAQVGTTYSGQLLSTTTGTATWSLVTGTTLPPGLNMNAAGLISGSPAGPGTSRVSVAVSDSLGEQATATFFLEVDPAGFVVITSALPWGQTGASYYAALRATAGMPASWSVQSGNLPPGLALSASGVISGTPTSVGAFTFSVEASSASGTNAVATLTINTAGPGSSIQVVTSAASYADDAIAPGEIVVLWGDDLGPAVISPGQLNAGGNMFTTMNSGTQVTIGGIPAPIIYTLSGQVSVVVPFDLASQTSTTIQVSYQGASSAPFTMPVRDTEPGLFTLDSSGSGPGAILNSDLSVNSILNGAKPGTTIVLFATGGGIVNPSGVDGMLAPSADQTVAKIAVGVNNIPATVTYAGNAPTLVEGVLQINVQLPDNLPSGAVPIVVRAGSSYGTAGVTVWISQN